MSSTLTSRIYVRWSPFRQRGPLHFPSRTLDLIGLLCKPIVMTNNNSHMNEDPRDLLETQENLVKRVRTSQRSTWFPLTFLSIVTFLAIPIERIGHRTVGNCTSATATTDVPHFCRIYSFSGLFYWPIALVIAYAVISYFYKTRSRELGAETGASKYVVPGVVISILLGLASYLLFLFSSGQHSRLEIYFLDPSNQIIFRIISPAFSICLALLFLARFERNLPLLICDVLYGAIVLWPPVRGIKSHGFWSLAPNRVIDGGFLLLIGLIFWLLQRRDVKQK